MLLDSTQLYSDDQAITATAVSTNVIDHGLIGSTTRARELAKGNPIRLMILVHIALLAAGAATLDFKVETDDNSGFSSATTVVSTGPIAKALLVIGFRPAINFLPEGLEQFSRINYVVATGPFTAGALTAGLLYDVDTNTL